MICPHCSFELPDHAVFCRSCGKRISDGAAPASQPTSAQAPAPQPVPTPVSASMAYPHAQTPSGPVYAVAQPAQPAAPTSRKRSGVAMGFAIGFAFIALLAAGLGLFQMLKGTQVADAAGMAKVMFDLNVDGETSQEALAAKDISIPLEITGTSQDGADVHATVVYRPGKDVITLPVGNYQVHMIGTPVGSGDTLYSYPDTTYHINVDAPEQDSAPVVVSPEQPMVIDQKPNVTQDEIDQAKQVVRDTNNQMEELGVVHVDPSAPVAPGSSSSAVASSSPASSSSSAPSSTTAKAKVDKAKLREAYLGYLRAAQETCEGGSATAKPAVAVHPFVANVKASEVQYAFYDLNGDGVEELILAPQHDGEASSSHGNSGVAIWHVLACSEAASGAVAEVVQAATKLDVWLHKAELERVAKDISSGFFETTYGTLDGTTAKLKDVETISATKKTDGSYTYKHKDAAGKESALDEGKVKEIKRKYSDPSSIHWHVLSDFDEQETRDEFAAIDQGPEAHKKHVDNLLAKREQERAASVPDPEPPATPANPAAITLTRGQDLTLSGTLTRVEEGPEITMMAWGRAVYYLEFPAPINVTYSDNYMNATRDMQRIAVHVVEVYDSDGGDLGPRLSQAHAAEWDAYVGSAITVAGTVTNTGNAHTPGLCMLSSASVV